MKAVQIEGSQNGADWKVLVQGQPVFRQPNGANKLPLALSPDGRHLAVNVDARRLQVWDLVEVRNQLRQLGVDWGKERSEVSPPKR